MVQRQSSDTTTRTEPARTAYWWVADGYERRALSGRDGHYLRPSGTMRWPDDFTVYSLDGDDEAELLPHDQFFRIGFETDWFSAERLDTLQEFVEFYGLLGGLFSPERTNAGMLGEHPWPDRFEEPGEEFTVLIPASVQPGQTIDDGIEAAKVTVRPASHPKRRMECASEAVTVDSHDRPVPFVQEVYSEYLGYNPVAHARSIRDSFYSFYKRFYDGLDPDFVDEKNPLDPASEPDVEATVGHGPDGKRVYKFTSLSNAMYFHAREDLRNNRIGWCDECGDFYRTDRQYNRRFCPEGTSGDGRCRSRAHERKLRQKKKFEDHLENHAPELLGGWPRTDSDYLVHPHDIAQDNTLEMTDEECEQVRAWVKKTRNHSSRDRPDPWLAPLSEPFF